MHALVVRSLVQVVVVIGLTTACRSPVSVDGTVTASIVGSTLRIDNSSSVPIYYLPVERETAAAINWSPCVEGPHCRVIAAASGTTIPLTEVSGFGATSAEVLVYWWRRVPELPLPTYRPGDIQVTVARR